MLLYGTTCSNIYGSCKYLHLWHEMMHTNISTATVKLRLQAFGIQLVQPCT